LICPGIKKGYTRRHSPFSQTSKILELYNDVLTGKRKSGQNFFYRIIKIAFHSRPLSRTLRKSQDHHAERCMMVNNHKIRIARLNGLKPKPDIKPSTLEKVPEDDKEKDPSEKRPGSDKRSNTFELTIHNTMFIAPEYILPGPTLE
jgi:hypothetical protein